MTAPPDSASRLPREPSRRLFLILWAAIVLLFVVMRVWAFRDVSRTIYARQVLQDAESYLAMAADFRDGAMESERAYFFGPGWPILLGTVFKVTGPGITPGRVLNVVLSLATLLLIGFSAARLGGRWTSLACGAVWALYKPALLYEQTILMETAAATSSAAILALWCALAVPRSDARPSLPIARWPWSAAALGVLLGLAAWLRANALVLAPVLFAATLWIVCKQRGRAHAALAGGLMTAACLLVIAPATIHNYRAEREFILMTSNAGINLWVGIGPQANGGYVPPPTAAGNEDPRGALEARRVLGREVSSREASTFWRERALENNSAGRIARLTLVKLAMFFAHREQPQIYHVGVMREDLAFLRAPLPGHACVAVPMLLGVAMLALRRKAGALALAIGALALIASLLPFFITGRYRLPLAPWLLVVSFAGLRDAARELAMRQWRHAAWLLLLVPPVVAGMLAPPLRGTETQFRQLLAVMHMREGDHETARNLIVQVNAERPTAFSLSTEAKIIEETSGDLERAAGLYRHAVAMRQDSARLWFNAAQAQLRTGRKQVAREYYERAVQLDPGVVPTIAWFNLGVLRMEADDVAGAREALGVVVEQDPRDEQARRLLERLE